MAVYVQVGEMGRRVLEEERDDSDGAVPVFGDVVTGCPDGAGVVCAKAGLAVRPAIASAVRPLPARSAKPT